jgi:hypothetical protein
MAKTQKKSTKKRKTTKKATKKKGLTGVKVYTKAEVVAKVKKAVGAAFGIKKRKKVA